jgi:RNA-directed DNA polymerase
MAETPSSETVSTRQQRIAELARQAPQMAFTSLNHYIDREWLKEAYRRTRKDGAVGVDGQTARGGKGVGSEWHEANSRSPVTRFTANT